MAAIDSDGIVHLRLTPRQFAILERLRWFGLSGHSPERNGIDDEFHSIIAESEGDFDGLIEYAREHQKLVGIEATSFVDSTDFFKDFDKGVDSDA